MDMSQTIAPKSDQLNYDDLIGDKKMTITITRVRGNNTADQPVSVFYEGDNGKPYKPCKSMRRVMVAAWGPDAHQYAGRSMTLYGDPRVKFGGIEVGGIRISHMTHIDRDMMIPLTVAKARRTPYTVKRLAAPEATGDQSEAPPPVDTDALIKKALKTAEGGQEVYKKFFSEIISKQERTALTNETIEDSDDFNRPKMVHEMCKAIAAKADAENDQSGGEY